MSSFSLEHMFEVWNDDGSGARLEIGEDRDGLDLVEIRQKSGDNKIEARITMQPEEARLAAIALGQIAADLKLKLAEKNNEHS